MKKVDWLSIWFISLMSFASLFYLYNSIDIKSGCDSVMVNGYSVIIHCQSTTTKIEIIPESLILGLVVGIFTIIMCRK